AAHFDRHFRAVTTRRGDPVSLTCKTHGESPIKLTWTRDGHHFNPTQESRYLVQETSGDGWSESVLRITNSDRRDSAALTCHAENPYGGDDTVFQLIVQEPPGKPQDLEAMQTTSRTVTLTWIAPYSGNSPVLKYLLEHKSSTGSWEYDTELSPEDTSKLSYLVTGLRPSTRYEFRVRAGNALGLSDHSDPLVVTTDQEAPSGPPWDIQVTPTGSRSLLVSWKAALFVCYNGSDSKERIPILPSSKRAATNVSGLLLCFRYRCSPSTTSRLVLLGFRGNEFLLRSASSHGNGHATCTTGEPRIGPAVNVQCEAVPVREVRSLSFMPDLRSGLLRRIMGRPANFKIPLQATCPRGLSYRVRVAVAIAITCTLFLFLLPRRGAFKTALESVNYEEIRVNVLAIRDRAARNASYATSRSVAEDMTLAPNRHFVVNTAQCKIPNIDPPRPLHSGVCEQVVTRGLFFGFSEYNVRKG
ncbi:hypothetical protein MRX96_052709, partial [Rhipicephalus microplus]